MKDITILLTGTGAPGAPGIIKCLRKNGERNIKIIGVDMNIDAGGKSMVDKFYVVPSANDSNFIESIKLISEKEKVNIIIPIVTKELMKFSKAKNYFGKIGIKVAVMDQEKLEIANDKGKLLVKLKKHNIQVPEFYIVNSLVEIEEACKSLGYPKKAVCVKITSGNGSRGVRIIDPHISRYELFLNSKPNSMYISYDEIMATLNEGDSIPEMLVMEYLPGQEYSVDVLAKDGNVVQIVGRYNSIVKSSIPLGSTLEFRKEPIDQTIEICKCLSLDGYIGIDYKYDGKGKPQVMEINPRLTATIVATAAASTNLPYLGIKQLLDEPIEIQKVNYGVKMTRHWQEVFTDKNGHIIPW